MVQEIGVNLVHIVVTTNLAHICTGAKQLCSHSVPTTKIKNYKTTFPLNIYGF